MQSHNFLTTMFIILFLLVWMIGCRKDNLTSPEVNHSPVITSLSAFPTNNIDGGETSVLKLVAIDPDNDDLSVDWSATGGVYVSTSNDSAVWQAPDSSGAFTCTTTVSDGKATVDSSVSITVTYGLKFVGQWVGKTSQNYPISLKVEVIGDYVAVTQMSYKIYLQGQGWGVTQEGTLGFGTPLEIDNKMFEYTGFELNVDGIFSDANSLSGNLSARSTHPQGLGTAYGSATYSAKKL